jgi:hypothetical protein
MKTRIVVAAALLLIATLLFAMQSPVTPVRTLPLRFPRGVGTLLVLVDRLPAHEAFVRDRAEQVAVGLRYLTPHTSWAYLDAASTRSVRDASAVVYLGLNGIARLTSDELATLHAARRLIVSEHHLRELRDAGVAFLHVDGGSSIVMPAGTEVRYRNLREPVTFAELLALNVRAPARTIGWYALPGGRREASIVIDGNAAFINAPLDFVAGDGTHGSMVAACDAIASFLGAPPNPVPLAMLRLEDVSAITPPELLGTIAYHLWRARVPYGIGVIPDLELKDGSAYPLQSNPALVSVLLWAQANGATIFLHGLHHCCSSEDAEGYEFWDFDRKAPVPNDSAAWMQQTVAEGLREERALGLRPLMWETPHYAASPLDYAVVSRMIPAAWEPRPPVSWLPWPLQRDQYGAVLLPENLGYVSLDGAFTLGAQLTRANALLACRYCVAVGFLHPALVSPSTVDGYVQGLRNLGYAFADPSQVANAVNE